MERGGFDAERGIRFLDGMHRKEVILMIPRQLLFPTVCLSIYKLAGSLDTSDHPMSARCSFFLMYQLSLKCDLSLFPIRLLTT